jgi:hypothetical protein
MSSAVADGLAAARSFKPGHGQLTAAFAAKPDWLGGQVGYRHHVLQREGVDLAVFADVMAGARKASPDAPWAPDVGALAGLKLTF